MSEIHSYSKVWNVGHRATNALYGYDVWVQEKIDGSQFSFMVDEDGELHMRSKGNEVYTNEKNKLFKGAVDYVVALHEAKRIMPGYTYRGEVLHAPRHNTLVYDRIPKNHIILFDVDRGDQDYLSYSDMGMAAQDLDLEFVPLLWEGEYKLMLEKVEEMLQETSVLGGQLIEGVVLKPQTPVFAPDGKMAMAKYVSTAFREANKKAWSKPTKRDVIETIIETYSNPARWSKAVQKLRESGEYEGSARDIGNLIRAIQGDIMEECEDDIKQDLWNAYKSQIAKGSARGVPDWYKKLLLEQAQEGVIDGNPVS